MKFFSKFFKNENFPQTLAVKKICACCGKEFEKYLPIPNEYLETLKKYNVPIGDPYEMLNPVEYTCPECGSSDRERAYALVIKKIIPPDKKIKFLDIAPRDCIKNFVKKNFPEVEYKTCDLLMPNVDYQLDITDLKEISDGSFDFVLCSHVMEHVNDDLKAMRELNRILTDEGAGIIVVPINLNRTEIDEDPNVTDVAERWRRFGQDDHVRAYSKQGFIERLKQSGFEVVEYDKDFFGSELMTANGLTETSVVYVVKPKKKAIKLENKVETEAETIAKNFIKNSILFDADWYKKNYGLGKYLDAAKHYLNSGWKEGKDPSPFFSTADYLKKYPDVRNAGMNPLLHFEQYGFNEGRYKKEINRVMPKILERHPECSSELKGGIIRVRITNACNAKCRYCGVRLGMGFDEEFNLAMNPSWYYELCRPLYENINLVLITGGDAFFAKESYNYMKFLSENFPRITVMTESNGIAFNEKFQKLACENLFKTHFSINASNAEIFAHSCWDRDDGDTAQKMYPLIIRNIKNYLQKLEAENKLCFAPDLSMVINRDNADDILDFTELALKLHSSFIAFFFDYTENDMDSDYFKNPEFSRPALKTMMELERVLAEKVIVYFRLWLPVKEAAIIQQEVEAVPIEELNKKYAKILKLAEGRSAREEFNQRNEFRRKLGKAELELVDDLSPTLHLREHCGRETCFAPWNEIDLYPDGQMGFCSWFTPPLNIKNFIQVKDGKEIVNWDEIINSYEYVSARYRILHEDFTGCLTCCPMNSVKNPIEPCTKYNLDRTL